MNPPASEGAFQCRTCLSYHPSTKSVSTSELFAGAPLPIYVAIMECASVQISKGDGFPKRICVVCMDKLQRAYDFRKLCKRSEDTLKNACVLSEECWRKQASASEGAFQCRSCLSYRPSTRSVFKSERFPGTKLPVYVAIMECASVQISKGDGFPKGICVVCMDRLRRAYDFRKLCKRSEDTLKSACVLSEEKCSRKEDGGDKAGDIEKEQENNKRENAEETLKTSAGPVNKKRAPAVKKEKIFDCSNCFRSFTTRVGLELHERYHDPLVGLPKTCTICNKTFRVPSTLQRHMLTHTGEKPITCKTCGKNFATLWSLKIHSVLHTGEKLYKCTTCDQSFADKSALRLHTLKHTGELPYVCDVCGKCFRQSGSLRSHIRTHTGEKPIKCRLCDRRFTLKSHLTVHMRTHSGEKPFKCITCDRCFRRSDLLKKHIRTHTGEKPYACKVCGKAFAQSSTRYTHMKTHNIADKTTNDLANIAHINDKSS